MNRKKQLWLLIVLSALTMAIPYAIQGALSTGSTPRDIHPYIYVADRIAWAIRALVEGLVIGYIARTQANTKLQGFVLWVLKLALIALIAITLGPVLYATSTNLPIAQTMSDGWHRFWAYALASYMPLMVLGAAYAYKTQPTDNEAQIVDSEEVAELERLLAEAQTENEKLEEILAGGRADANGLVHQIAKMKEDARAMQNDLHKRADEIFMLEKQVKAIADWNLLNATAKSIWIAQHTNGDRPPASQLAKVLGCAVSTVSRAYEVADKGGTK
jgi:hypothetical protein